MTGKPNAMLTRLRLAALAACLALGAPAMAQDAPVLDAPSDAIEDEASGAGGHEVIHIERQDWSFAGVFGTFDRNQLQRGFQVFQATCASCHGMRLIAFRNLAEPGGPEFSEDQVKTLAATSTVADADAEGGTRPGVPADHWPSPLTEAEGRDFYGVAPPDLSVMAKARSVTDPFPTWMFNYFTAYAEGGPDYIHALLMGYEDPPADFALPEGKYYNAVFPGHAISMPPQLSDGAVPYAEGVPRTADQYAKDVSAFLMWAAEPGLVARKEAGFRVMAFLLLFAVLMFFVKDKLWRPIHHHNPSPAEVAARGRTTPPAP